MAAYVLVVIFYWTPDSSRILRVLSLPVRNPFRTRASLNTAQPVSFTVLQAAIRWLGSVTRGAHSFVQGQAFWVSL